ncbi:MAG: hypothetical protein GY953_51640, partial [bacterium]|nr:hypothetical protein [bacterium]
MIANSPSRLETWLATALALLLAWGVVTLWVPGRWAVATVQVGIYLLTAIWVLAALRFKLHLHFHAVMIPLGGAVLWGVLQLAAGTTIYRWSTEVATLDWFTRLAIFFLVFQVFDSLTLRRRFLDWFLWFGFALAVLASLQRFTTPKQIFWLFDVESTGNVMGPFIYHNQYAAFVELVLPVSLLAARQRWTYAVIPAVLIASVIAANSRAGAFLVIAEFALILVL